MNDRSTYRTVSLSSVPAHWRGTSVVLLMTSYNKQLRCKHQREICGKNEKGNAVYLIYESWQFDYLAESSRSSNSFYQHGQKSTSLLRRHRHTDGDSRTNSRPRGLNDRTQPYILKLGHAVSVVTVMSVNGLNLRGGADGGSADPVFQLYVNVIGQSWFDLDPQIHSTRKSFARYSVRISWHFSENLPNLYSAL